MAIRVYQIAKEYSKDPDEVIRILKENGIKAASPTTPLDEHALHTLRAKLGGFKLSVVDGDQDQVGETPAKDQDQNKEQAKKPKTLTKKQRRAAKEAAPPSLKVRIIKKHEDEDDHDSDEQASTDSDEKPPTKPRPRLRRSRARKSQIKDKISHALAEKGTDLPATPAAGAPHGSDAAGAPAAAAGAPGGPAAKSKSSKHEDKKSGKPEPIKRAKEYQVDIKIGQLSDSQERGRGKKREKPRRLAQQGNRRPSANANNAPGNIPPMMPPGAQAVPKSGGAKTANRPRFGANANQRPGARKKRKKKKNAEHLEKIRPVSTVSKVALPEEDLGIIMLSEGVTVKELAEKVNRMSKDVIKRLMEKGVFATINDVLDKDLAIDIAKDFGYLAEIVSFEEDLQIKDEEQTTQYEGAEEQSSRAPIVTIMGHVDHGKTTLLDTIRKTRVASGESGGITQHIGAYSVSCNDQPIVFLDTPGHEAFTKMRARGASVTDIVILVVAADDGVKPQTIEAINHAKAAKVPIITCINKIDKPEANPDRVKTMLTEHELIVEEFGGDSPCVAVSAKRGDGIQDLLEMILLVAELQDFKAVPKRKARGTVVEAKLDRGRGPVATVLVQDGTTSVGDYFITGSTYGKIRAMHDDLGEAVESAGPSTPIEIIGIQAVPSAGDQFQVVEDEVTARQISTFRQEKDREEHLRSKKISAMDQLFSKIKQGEVKELPVIIKADTQGSVEGIVYALQQIKSEKVKIRVIHQGVGNVTENDVLLAQASEALVVGFHVKAESKADDLAAHEGVTIRLYEIIYEIVNDVEKAMLGMLEIQYEEEEVAKVSVRAVFSIPKIGKIAGCYVDSGTVYRNCVMALFRGGEQIYKGKISSLKRFKDDANEVKSGLECGIALEGFSSIQEGDEMVAYRVKEVVPTEL